MIYPAAVISIAAIVVTIILWKVIPTFAELFAGLGAELPLPTRIVIAASNMLAKYGVFVVLGVMGIIYLIKKDEGDPFVRDQAAEALNFNLSFFIYLAVGSIVTFVLILVLIGLLLLPLLAAMIVAWVVFVIIGAVRANNGELYRYPLTIRFVS